jgi:peptide-N4-(N-acetyl-beta-glucosaminyl)asparagine amidase
MMDTLQAEWIADEAGRLAEAEREELGGRVSGPADWRAARMELGLHNVERPKYHCEHCHLYFDLQHEGA